MKSTSYAWLLAAAIGSLLASTAAYADKTKTCTVDVNTRPMLAQASDRRTRRPPACTSNSDTGLDNVKRGVMSTNSQGHTVPKTNRHRTRVTPAVRRSIALMQGRKLRLKTDKGGCPDQRPDTTSLMQPMK